MQCILGTVVECNGVHCCEGWGRENFTPFFAAKAHIERATKGWLRWQKNGVNSSPSISSERQCCCTILWIPECLALHDILPVLAASCNQKANWAWDGRMRHPLPVLPSSSAVLLLGPCRSAFPLPLPHLPRCSIWMLMSKSSASEANYTSIQLPEDILMQCKHVCAYASQMHLLLGFRICISFI